MTLLGLQQGQYTGTCMFSFDDELRSSTTVKMS